MDRSWLKAAHDRVFAQWIYRVQRGPMAGYLRRGRMPWFQPTPSAQLEAETQFLAGLGLNGATVYDVGSNIGSHALLFRRLVGPAGAVHAFEPDPIYRRALLDLVVLNRLGNVEVHGWALGAGPGTAELVIPDPRRVRASATLQPELIEIFGDAEVRRATVRVGRLDDVIDAFGLPKPDLIKVDVEGFECEVVEGAANTLKSARPQLFIEVHGATPDAQRERGRRLLQQLEALGYRRFRHVEREVDLTVDTPPAGGHVWARAGA